MRGSNLQPLLMRHVVLRLSCAALGEVKLVAVSQWAYLGFLRQGSLHPFHCPFLVYPLSAILRAWPFIAAQWGKWGKKSPWWLSRLLHFWEGQSSSTGRIWKTETWTRLEGTQHCSRGHESIFLRVCSALWEDEAKERDWVWQLLTKFISILSHSSSPSCGMTLIRIRQNQWLPAHLSGGRTGSCLMTFQVLVRYLLKLVPNGGGSCTVKITLTKQCGHPILTAIEMSIGTENITVPYPTLTKPVIFCVPNTTSNVHFCSYTARSLAVLYATQLICGVHDGGWKRSHWTIKPLLKCNGTVMDQKGRVNVAWQVSPWLCISYSCKICGSLAHAIVAP